MRIIGIDTPEIGRDGEPSECYAHEARDFVDALLYGRDVELRSDATQADIDAYGRLLRHVIVDGHSATAPAEISCRWSTKCRRVDDRQRLGRAHAANPLSRPRDRSR